VGARFRHLYGASPLHLLALTASLLIAGAAVAGWFESFPGPTAARVLAWFLGAIVAHDLVLLPLYSLLDRVAFGPRGSRRTVTESERGRGAAYLRIPALLSGLIFLVFFPEILRLGDHNFFRASGLHQRVFLARYLLVCGALFTFSALAYALRLRRSAPRGGAVRRLSAARSRIRPSRAEILRALRSRMPARLASLTRRRGGRRRA
jgi:hypothetical protein